MNGSHTFLNKTNIFILQVPTPVSRGINQKYIHTFPAVMVIKCLQDDLSPTLFVHAHETKRAAATTTKKTTCNHRDTGAKGSNVKCKLTDIQIAGGGEREQRVLVYISS